MPTITHTPTPAQMDMISRFKEQADIASAMLNNAIAMIVAGVAPVGSKLEELKDGVMTISIPETKVMSKDVQVDTPANLESTPKPE